MYSPLFIACNLYSFGLHRLESHHILLFYLHEAQKKMSWFHIIGSFQNENLIFILRYLTVSSTSLAVDGVQL